MTSLLDVLKETDLRVDFTPYFTGTGTRTALDHASLQQRLLLCLFGLGTHTGLKRGCATMPEDAYHELWYVRRHYLHAEALRNASAHVANAIFRIRATPIWGEGTTACASDAKPLGARDQNLLGTQKQLRIPKRHRRSDNIYKPVSQRWQPLELGFNRFHRLLGQFDARLLGGGHPFHDGGLAVPGHGAGTLEHRVNRVEQGPVPMVVYDAPTAFDRVVLA